MSLSATSSSTERSSTPSAGDAVAQPSRSRPAPKTFRIQLQRANGNLIHVTASGPAGAAKADVQAPSIPALPDDPDERWRAAVRTGEHLFAVAFPPPVLKLLEESRYQVGDDPLPVILLAGDDLGALPWELLRDPESERFLALHPRHPLFRSVGEVGTSADRAPPPVGKLRVQIVTPAADETTIALAAKIGAPPRVEVSIAAEIAEQSPAPHVLHLVPGATLPAEMPDIRLVVCPDGVSPADSNGSRLAVLTVPSSMPTDRQADFFARWYESLANGLSLEHSTLAARRALATAHGVTDLAWASPVLTAPDAGQVLVRPSRNLGLSVDSVGNVLKERGTSWFSDTLSGIASSVVVFLVGLLLYRVGFSSSPEFSLDILSPWSLYQSFKGLILELSTYQEHFLLIAAGILLLLTLVVGFFWTRTREIPKEERRGLIWHFADPFSSLRTVAFVGVAALVVAGAFAYQQYLWQVALPIPDDAIGFAITKEAAAASFSEEFADALYAQGQTKRIVVRELPVRFDARHTDQARELGRRIGARAVIIYRQDDQGDGARQYVAYVVFTDPNVGLTVGSAAPSALTQPGQLSTTSAPTVQIREGLEIPALRTENLTELVNAAAGVVALHENRAREAIALLEQAVPRDTDAPNTGIINFYLGAAYFTADDMERTAEALDRAATFYEGRQQAGWVLGPQDLLILAKTYLLRSRADQALTNDPQSAIPWLEKAVALREATVARAGNLERPIEVHSTFARVFAELANQHRRLNQPDEQTYWEGRADDELAIIQEVADPTDTATAVQEAGVRFFAGDCVGALRAADRALAIDPQHVDALTSAGIVAMFQGRPDDATERWETSLAVRPDDIVALQTLAAIDVSQALGGDLGTYVDLVYLEQAEEHLRAILDVDPVNLQAQADLATNAWFRAHGQLSDLTALTAGDLFTYSKSRRLWRQDRDRRDAAVAALGDAIEARRMIAAELRRDDPSAWAALALAYKERANLVYTSLNALYGFPVADPNDPLLLADGKRIVADAAAVREWAGRVLADGSGASRLDRLHAHAALVEALEWEWSWHYFFATDKSRVEELADEFTSAIDAAIAEIEAEEVTTLDEIDPARAIYFVATFAAIINSDEQREAEYRQKINGLTAREMSQRTHTATLDATYCREERFRLEGDTALTESDLPGARAAYEHALAANPEHVPALRGLADVLFREGDAAGAREQLNRATELAPRDPQSWARLGLTLLVTGDVAGRDEAYARFFEITASLPPQEQMAHIRLAIGDLQALLDRSPQRAEAIRAALPALVRGLDAMPVETHQTLQYPLLYEQLGSLALLADDPATAEILARRAIELDAHLPTAHTALILSVLAQGRDASAELDALSREINDPFWQADGGEPNPATVLSMIEDETERYLRQFPDRRATVEPALEPILGAQAQ